MKNSTINLTAICCTILLSGLLSCSNSETTASLDDVLATVDGEIIKFHIAYLADDKLKGRLPGTPEYDLAVEYVTQQYTDLGLLPAGTDGSFLQEVTIRKGLLDEANSALSLVGSTAELVQGEDYYFLANLNDESSVVDGEVVFVGYGIEAQNLSHNDYEGKDVTGKIVLMIAGAPDNFESSARAHFANYGTKFETAMKNGAVGILMSSEGAGANFNRVVSRFRDRGNTGVVGDDGETFGRRVFGPEIKFMAFLNWDSWDKLFGKSADEIWSAYGEKEPAKPKLMATTKTTYKQITSPNIIAKLPGKNENEYIVHSAHLDHVGIGRPIDGDSIYNGAHDNASGVASLIEIARLYTKLPEKPNRSILFVMVTAEEMGLLGSDYFTRYPTVDINAIVANVNTDMPTLIAPLLSIEPLGAEHSSLMGNVEEAAAKLDLEIMPDHMPEQVRFVRSDQYNFIRQGIPALHVKYGLKSLDSLNDLSEKINDYTANVYHKPSDELNELFDFEAAEVYVKLNFLISYSISESPERPKWNEGDFFAK